MSKENAETIETYENHIQEYIAGTPQVMDDASIQKWIGESLSGLDLTAKILELGSAFGRDIKYIEDLGYKVEGTDATAGFVDLLQQQGHDAQLLNVLTDEIEYKYDLIFANAVLLHFTQEEIEKVTLKICKSLKPNGRFSFSLKQGNGEEWSNAKVGAPRYFKYWQPKSITKVLEAAGFNKIKVTGNALGTNRPKWLHIIAEK